MSIWSTMDKHFNSLRTEQIAFLELGIYKGGSLLMWRDYFQNGDIFGLDNYPVEIEDHTGRIRTYKGRQEDTELMNLIRKESAPEGFDIMVGFVKELVDEMAMGAITNPSRGSRVNVRKNKASATKFTAGQVFVFKSVESIKNPGRQS